MDVTYEEEIEKRVKNIDRTLHKEVVVLGGERECTYLIKLMKKNDIEVTGCIRNDTNRGDLKSFQGVKIISIEDLLKKGDAYAVSFENPEVLKLMKNAESNIEFLFISPDQKEENFNRIQIIKRYLKNLDKYCKGYCLYKKLMEKYHVREILVFSGQSGDLFNALSYLDAYRNAMSLGDEFVLTVINEACFKVAKMFGVKNVEKMSVVETKEIILLYELCGSDINILPLHCSEAHIKNTVYTKMIRREGITLGKMYKYQAFMLNEMIVPHLPNYIRNSEYVETVFQEKHYPKGRTVLVSPYANSYMDDNVLIEWRGLCRWLKKKGYRVLTNCGNKSE